MSRIFKLGLGSLGWHWGLFEVIPILFKNKVMKKTKRYAVKSIWMTHYIKTYLTALYQKLLSNKYLKWIS